MKHYYTYNNNRIKKLLQVKYFQCISNDMKRDYQQFKKEFHAVVKLDMTKREIGELFNFNSGSSLASWLKTRGLMIGYMPLLVPYKKKGNKKRKTTPLPSGKSEFKNEKGENEGEN